MVQLQHFFQEYSLIYPQQGYPTIVDLIRYLAKMAGVHRFDPSSLTTTLDQHLQGSQHIVLVLLDGLGMSTWTQAKTPGFLQDHLALQLLAVAPSTTACALTSLATGQYPNNHAITGWFTHLPKFNRTATVLPFTDRYDGRPLQSHGIQIKDVFLEPSVMAEMDWEAGSILPAVHWNSDYSQYFRGSTRGVGYNHIDEAFEYLISWLGDVSRESFTFLYIPDIDTLSHVHGPDAESVSTRVEELDRELEKLWTRIQGKARLVITADHGLIGIPPDSRFAIQPKDPLLKFLQIPPSGEARLPIFHLHDVQDGGFVTAFQERFGDAYWLLSIDQIEKAEIFGPGQMTPLARARFGDYVAIPLQPTTLAYYGPGEDPSLGPFGYHGAFSPQEMLVPLFVL